MGLLEDARNIQRKDPAARSVLEVILLYPGFHILVYHRIAHWLYQHKRFFLARWVSQHGRRRTGIEIHPGATIGRCLFIDHGMGIVFGETCEIGDNCTIYHGVTLGGTGKDTGKRHPTLGNNVLIGAGTKVLGPVYIGDNSRIGAGSVVLRNLPANCTAVGVPARIVRCAGKPVYFADDVDQIHMADPVLEELVVPVQGEAAPHGVGLGVVEGEDDEHEDGGVEEEEHQYQEQPGEDSVLFHRTTASPSPSPKRFMIPMLTRTMTIITREMAEPRWGL